MTDGMMREIPGTVCAAKGFKAGAAYAGIRKAERDDLVMIVSEVPASVAGVFTTNRVHAWCVKHNRDRIKAGKAQGVLCNAGNANACNGERGQSDDKLLSEIAAKALTGAGVVVKAPLLTASTGVIGHHLPMRKVEEGVPKVVSALGDSAGHGERAASGIMTTDLVPKSVAIEIVSGKERYVIGGICKGSGMIAPNMATMLGFITTDIEAEPAVLQAILSRVVGRTFNRITVDGDTSTNDMVLLLANGRSGMTLAGREREFETALEYVCGTLARKIARDGEGATKLVSIKLVNPPPGGEKIAKTIAESPLVKTACFGNDPNWGRIMAAAGRSGVDFDPYSVVVRLAGFEVFKNGEPTAFDAAAVSNAMKQKDLLIELEFIGATKSEEITVWTCDFSYDYVKINADYTT